MSNRIKAIAAATALSVAALAPQGAAAQDSDTTICFVTFSLQIEYFQKTVDGA